jgi:hypothetical protein
LRPIPALAVYCAEMGRRVARQGTTALQQQQQRTPGAQQRDQPHSPVRLRLGTLNVDSIKDVEGLADAVRAHGPFTALAIQEGAPVRAGGC